MRQLGLFFFVSAVSSLVFVQNVQSAGNFVIQNGSTVSIHYTLTVDQRVVDSSIGKAPLTYVQGKGQIIPGLEEKLQGSKVGDKKKVSVPPSKGYGSVDGDAFQIVPKKTFKNAKSLKVGTVVTGQYGTRPVQATIISIDGDKVTLDLNHPLAGKTLQFDVEVVSVK